MLAKAACDKFLKCLDHLQEGRFDLTLPDGRQYVFQGKDTGLKADMQITDWQVPANLARGGDTAMAEDYAAGKWQTTNLQNVITLALHNEDAVKTYIFGNPIMRILYNLSYMLHANTMKGSRRNIQSHYDLGNAFYKLWLDPGMTYSSALYKSDADSLSDAQHHKYDRILDNLGSMSGNTLEIGCGWGGYAERAMQKGDFAIKGITLSDEQCQYARQRLSGHANITLEDYRIQDGTYDHIVSIEMFEAVGEKYWKTYFNKVAALLKSGGNALIQTITIDEARFETYRKGQDFIRGFIFPGGMLPSNERFKKEAADAGLRLAGRFDFGQDYARTLENWLHTFDAQKQQVLALGYDEVFIRMWRFYLAACAAGFCTGRTSVSQFHLQHAV